jgi:hypothetical protein
MKLRHGRTGLIAGVAALIAAGACSKGGTVVDDGLKSDLAAAAGSRLELAPKAGSQSVVSAIEGGPTSSPKRAPQPRVQKPVARPAARVAAPHAPTPRRVMAQAATPTPVRTEAAAPPVSRPAPAPAPVEQPGRVYKTEAEIFRQMPWIRP